MTSNLPESARLAHAEALAREAKSLVPGMKRMAEVAEELRTDDLYRLLGFDTWDVFCTEYLGVSKRTANRWLAGKRGPKAISVSSTEQPKTETAGQGVAAGQNVPLVESEALNFEASSAEPEPTLDVPALSKVRTAEGLGAAPRKTAGQAPGVDTLSTTPTVSEPDASPVAPPEPAPPVPRTFRAEAALILDRVQAVSEGAWRVMTPGQWEIFVAPLLNFGPKPKPAPKPAKEPALKTPKPSTKRETGICPPHPIGRKLGTGCGKCGSSDVWPKK